MASFSFNANEVDPSSGAGAIPAGDYELHCIEANLKPNSKGTGELLELTFEVLSGEYASRKIWERLNVRHDNPIAQKIGQEALSALCHAMGALQVNDTEELLWKPFVAKVAIEPYKKNDGSDAERNLVKKYYFEQPSAPPEGKPEPSRAAPNPSTARSTGNGGSAPSRPVTGGANVPWKRSA